MSFEQLREEVRKAARGPLDIIYDAVGVLETQLAAYDILAPGGTLVTVALRPAIPAERLQPDKRLVSAFGQANRPKENRVVAAKMYKKLTTWLEEGAIKVSGARLSKT